MSLKLTQTGWKALVLMLLLVALGSLFLDYIIIGAGIIVAILLAYTLFQGYTLYSAGAEAHPHSTRIAAVAGKEFLLSLTLVGLNGWEVSVSNAPELGVHKVDEGDERRQITLTGLIRYASLRRLDTLLAHRVGWYGLFEYVKEVSLEPALELVVYPEFVTPLYRLLGREQYLEFEETSSTKVLMMNTGEYRETREYYPGDETRFIDWKATARTGELKVKVFSSEGAGRVKVILDNTSTDIVSADKLAAQFISTLLDYIEQGYRVDVLFYDGRNYNRVGSRGLVTETAETAVSMVGRHFPEIGRVLELPILNQGDYKDLQEDDAEKLSHLPTEGNLSSLIVVSQLITDIADDIAIASRKVRTVVIQPTSPWLWVKNLEDAYLCKTTILKNIDALRRVGVKVISYQENTYVEKGGLDRIAVAPPSAVHKKR
jgi:uncharacterized protein (DUF58 family)